MTTRRTPETTRSSGGEACYYANELCSGATWQCVTCGEFYCQTHWHETEKGHNKECVACERSRKDAKLLDADDPIDRLTARVDVGDKLDVRDK